jgi:excisionase family DNA binding protein
MEKQKMEVRLLNIREVAEILHVSRTLVYSLLKRGDIPTVRIERVIRVRQEDLERYIHERSFKKCGESKADDRDIQG